MRTLKLVGILFFGLFIFGAGSAFAGNLLVSSANAREFDPDSGAFLGNFGDISTTVNEIVDWAFSATNGNLFIAETNTIWEFDGTTGSFIKKFFQLTSSQQVERIGFHPVTGNLFIWDGGATALGVRQLDGSTGADLGIFVSIDPATWAVRDFVFHPVTGNLLILQGDRTPLGTAWDIKEYDGTTGSLIGVFGQTGDPAVIGSEPKVITFHPTTGNLFVLNIDARVLDVHVIDGIDGTGLGTFGDATGLPVEGFYGGDFIFDPSFGNLWILVYDGTSTAIRKYDGTSGLFLEEVVGNIAFTTKLIFNPNFSVGNLEVVDSADLNGDEFQDTLLDDKISGVSTDEVTTTTVDATGAVNEASTTTADAAGAVNEASTTTVAAVSTLKKNYLLNANFDIWQRDTTFEATSNETTVTADLWRIDAPFFSGGGPYILSRGEFIPGTAGDPEGEPRYYHRSSKNNITVTSLPGALGQRVEGVRRISGKTVTFSVWMRASEPGTVDMGIKQSAGGGIPTPPGNMTYDEVLGMVTVDMGFPHGMNTGQLVDIQNALPPEYNNVLGHPWSITVTGPNTFTYVPLSAPSAPIATGPATAISAEEDTPLQTRNVTTSWAKYSATFDVPEMTNKMIDNGRYPLDFFATRLEWTSVGSAAPNATWDVVQAQLVDGTEAADVEPKSFAEHLRDCQRYIYKSFPHDVPIGQGAGPEGAISRFIESGPDANTHGMRIRFPVPMYRTGGFTTYNPARMDGLWFNASDGRSSGMAGIIQQSEFGFTLTHEQKDGASENEDDDPGELCLIHFSIQFGVGT